MRDVLGKLAGFAGALLAVAGVIAVASFVIGLLCVN